MTLTTENIILIGSILLFISIVVGKTSLRFGIPTLVLFLGVGMMAGSEGIGGINFNDPKIAQFIGILSLNVILFSGGLDTDWQTIKPVLWQGISLSTVGVLLTAVTLGVFVWAVTDFTIYEALLLGSIVSSTDAAAVFSILRSKRLALKSNLRPTLELESGSNDPMAYVLTIAFLGLVLNPEQSAWSLLFLFFKQMLLGTIGGYLFGRISKYIINKIHLVFEGLYPLLVIALMYITFAATDLVGGNGFLAVYLCGVYLGNQILIHKRTILRMFDGTASLMQIVLFLTLGLLVFPSQILPVMGIGLLISLFLIFVARPVSVLLGLLPFKMKFRRRIYISWVGLRGAVPIVFATYPLLAGIEKANMIFNIVFFISLTSVLIQGTTVAAVAKWLHVQLPEKVRRRTPVEIFMTEHGKTRLAELEIPENSFAAGKKIVDLHFPRKAIIAMIHRGEEFITPNGSTVINAKDVLVILTESKDNIEEVKKRLQLD
ncbi:MAG: potassium/proton antiporter [Cytophagaceae bacterium]|nr:potassium/proton antiporter [Cytophagaceae bacterium]